MARGRPRKTVVSDSENQELPVENNDDIVSVVGNSVSNESESAVVVVKPELKPIVVDDVTVGEKLTPSSKPCPANHKIVRCTDMDEITRLSFSGKLVGYNPKTGKIQVKLD